MKNDRIEEYSLLNNAYYGDGGFLNGKYLVQHPRESSEKYQQRLALAYYLNYTSPCVNAHVDPIFKRDPQREYSGAITALWEDFAKDTDLAGTDLNTLVKRWAVAAKLYGIGYVVCDNAPQPGSTIGEILESKKGPMPIYWTLTGLKRSRWTIMARSFTFLFRARPQKQT